VGEKGGLDDAAEVVPSKIHIGNLTRNVNKDHIEEIFGVYGRIRSISLPINGGTGMNRGFAHVEYENKAEADNAIACMNEGQIDGRKVRVAVFATRESRH
jgi:RNA-binding protein with serine-rich domain 1